MQIIEAIAAHCRDLWPTYDVKITINTSGGGLVNGFIRINRLLDAQKTKIWICNIVFHSENISLFLKKSRIPLVPSGESPSYCNIISDPASLDELFAILTIHIDDVEGVIPPNWKEFGGANEPTKSELDARKKRAAIQLMARLSRTQ